LFREEALKPEAVNLADKLSQFSDHWSPKIVGQFNDNDIMVVKVQGEFVWHDHPDTDDFFLVLDGEVRIETEDGDVTLGPGELYVVPKGKKHRPVADREAHLLLIEPRGTPNTGDEKTAVTKQTI
jgi:mannose-6-phosphate isomerase-like protein (cupin superfamily)